MSGTLIALIILAAIIGGYLIDYQKNKLKWQSKNVQSDQELDEMRKLMQHMKKRIENLEAIVVDDSFDTSKKSPGTAASIEIDDQHSMREENEKAASKKAKTKGDY